MWFLQEAFLVPGLLFATWRPLPTQAEWRASAVLTGVKMRCLGLCQDFEFWLRLTYSSSSGESTCASKLVVASSIFLEFFFPFLEGYQFSCLSASLSPKYAILFQKAVRIGDRKALNDKTHCSMTHFGHFLPSFPLLKVMCFLKEIWTGWNPLNESRRAEPPWRSLDMCGWRFQLFRAVSSWSQSWPWGWEVGWTNPSSRWGLVDSGVAMLSSRCCFCGRREGWLFLSFPPAQLTQKYLTL